MGVRPLKEPLRGSISVRCGFVVVRVLLRDVVLRFSWVRRITVVFWGVLALRPVRVLRVLASVATLFLWGRELVARTGLFRVARA